MLIPASPNSSSSVCQSGKVDSPRLLYSGNTSLAAMAAVHSALSSKSSQLSCASFLMYPKDMIPASSLTQGLFAGADGSGLQYACEAMMVRIFKPCFCPYGHVWHCCHDS